MPLMGGINSPGGVPSSEDADLTEEEKQLVEAVRDKQQEMKQ